MPNFKCLFFLENDGLQLVEVKHTDLDENAEASEIFKWLRIDSSTNEVSQLIFSTMDSSGEIEERYFEEGYLKFNSKTGTFIEKFNSAQHALVRRDELQLPVHLQNLIETFIESNKHTTTV